LKITHLNAHDLSGGAARSAYRLHSSLRDLGYESRLLTLYKESSDLTVLSFNPPRDLRTRLRRGLSRRFLARTQMLISSRPAGSPFFTVDRSQHNADVLRQLPQSDILNLHWIAGFFDYGSFFRGLPRGMPVVWTLHDMNPLTGGCHHAADCRRFQASCGACPQLSSNVENDLSRQIWNRKRRAYDSLTKGTLSFVTPSRWLASKVKESSLAGRFPVNVIPYGLDTETFRPQEAQMARHALGIPVHGPVILFASYFARDNYKGFPFLLEALNRMRPIPNLHVVRVGGGEPEANQKLTVPIQSLGFIKDEKQMSLVYSAADLFILPSLQDNFPNTALEALSCGIPTVAFHVGGVPEIVRNGCTGTTVSPGDSEGLARAMEDLLRDPDRRATISSNCRRIAVQEYSLEIQAKRYMELYETMLTSNALQAESALGK
jgi:glycosyltransferase involved in cell wall biosynthesis